MDSFDSLFTEEDAKAKAPPLPAQDEFDQLFEADTLANSLLGATGANPDAEAKKQKLAKELAIPAAILPPDAEAVAAAKRNDPEAIKLQSPKTAKFLEVEDNAKITGHDGIKGLQNIEKAHATYSPDNIKTFIEGYTATGKTPAEAARTLGELKKNGIDLGELLAKRAGRAWGDVIPDIAKSIAGGTNMLLAGAVETTRYMPAQYTANALAKAITGRDGLEETQDLFNRGADYWQEEKSAKLKERLDAFNKAGVVDSIGMLVTEPMLLTDQLAQSLPYLVPGAGVAKAGPTAVLTYNALAEAADAANTARLEAKANGASPFEQDRSARIAALVTAPIAFLGNKLAGTGLIESKFFTKGTTGHNLLSTMLREAFSGAMEEGGNTFGVNVGASFTHDPLRDVYQNVAKSAAVGGFLESVHGGAMTTAEQALRLMVKDADRVVGQNSSNTVVAATAEATYETMSELSAQASENALLKRSPEAFNAFVETMAEDSNLTDVYVSGQVLEAAMQTAGFTTQNIGVLLPEVAAQLQEARITNGDVRIPVADYLTHFATTPINATLLPELKAEPNGATYTEAQAFYQTQQEQFAQQIDTVISENEPLLTREQFVAAKANELISQVEDVVPLAEAAVTGEAVQATQEKPQAQAQVKLPGTYEQYVAEHRNKAAAYAADVKSVADNINGQFKSTGRFTPSVTSAYTAPLVEFYKTQAKNFNTTPSAMYKKYPFKVQSFLSGTTEQNLSQGSVATLDDFRADNIKDILTKSNWTILTAENPGAAELSPEENAARMQELTDQLDAEGMAYQLVDGMYERKEKSLILFNSTPDQALALGRQFDQESVLTRDGYIYQDGTRTPTTGEVTVHEMPPEDYYTTVTFPDGTVSMFTIGLDFGTRLQPGEVYLPVQEIGQGAPQEEAPAFKKWFGGSKVVDAEGKPLVVYHGTGAKFTEFKGTELAGWFSKDIALAKNNYAGMYDNPSVMEVYLSIKNPKVISEDMNDFGEDGQPVYSKVNNAEYVNSLIEQGYDGIFVKQDGVETYAAFLPEQIKSATGNNGHFDPNDANILRQGGKLGQVAIKGVHFSPQQRPLLSGQYYGTGIKGQEADRLRQSKDSRIKNRLNFYVDEGKGVFPEYGVGNFRHDVTLDNMYDGARNPQKFPTRNAQGERDMNLFESAVVDAGFQGYYVQDGFGRQGSAVVLGDASRNIKPDSELKQSAADVSRALEAKLANHDAAVAEYATRPDSLNGKILNTDVARELSPDYLANRSLAAAVHEVSSDFIKKLYEQKLAEAPAAGELPIVLFTAGGTGAGKTSALLQADANVLMDKQIIYDTNMATYESSEKKVEQALRAGKAVDIRLTIRNPIDGLINGALPRAMRQEQKFGTGRPVRIKNHAATYLGAPEVIQKLAEKYKGNPLVSFKAYDNSFGKGNAVEIDVADANKYVYNSQYELEELLLTALKGEYDKGKISESVARATAVTSRGDEANRVITEKIGQGVSQSSQQKGELNQTVSTRTPYAVGSEDPHLTSELSVGLEALNKAPDLKDKVAKIVAGYMTFKKGPKTTDGIIKNFIQQVEDNLLWVYDQVPDEVKSRSKMWYEGGSRIAERWVDKYQGRYSKAQMAASLAVMSPTMPWDINISLSERLVDIYTNQQNASWDEDMSKVADAIAANNPNRVGMIDAVRGKKLYQVEGRANKGVWMRIFDEAHNPRSYRLPTPEGGFGDIAMTKAGKPSSVAYLNGFVPIAKLVSVLEDGSMTNISKQLGEAHKVRNFYNNLFDPADARSVTIDTHAVAVGLLLPLGASSTEVMNALNGTGGSNAAQGLTGTYALFADAYRRAAQKRGVLPREMQSITWEAGRGLFNPAFKGAHNKNPKLFAGIWGDYTSGKADINETRQRILEASGGIQNPSWTKSDPGLYEGAPASSYTGDVLSAGGVQRTASPRTGDGTTSGVSLNQNTLGSFNVETLTTTLLSGANFSTMIHENGHFYLKMLQDLGGRSDAPAQVKEDYLKTMEWFGITPNAWEAMTLDQQRPYHEQWAESFERWNMEGRAPTLALQPIFSRFRAWLLSVYKSMDAFLEVHPAAGKLNDEVRGIFARLMATEEAIRATEEARGYQPLFTNAAEAGVSQTAFDEYIALGKQATLDAVDSLQARSMRDMKWLSNARTKVIKELQASANAERKAIAEAVTAEVLAEPVNQARTFLRTGETKAPNGDLIKLTEGYKLNTEALARLYPQGALDTPDLAGLRGMTAENGLDPDIVASMFGFDSGDALVRTLLDSEKPADKIIGLTDQRMLEEHGDLIDERSVQRAADEAVHNEARAKFMATGLKMLTNSPITPTQMAKAAKQAADSTIAAKRVRDIKPYQYQAAESKASKNVLKLLPKDPDGAASAQRAALLSNRLAAASHEALAEVDKALKYLAKFNKDGTRKNIDIEYIEQIDALLEPFDLRKGPSLTTLDANTSLAEWVAQQEAMGFEPTIDPEALAAARQKSYKNMTMEELRGLLDGIKQIEHMGRLKKKLLTAQDKAEFATVVAEAKASILVNAGEAKKQHASPNDVVGKIAQWGRHMAAVHRKFSSLMKQLDGGEHDGYMFNLLVKTGTAAANNETEMMAQAADAMGELFAPVWKGMQDGFLPGNIHAVRKVVPGTRHSMTHEERIMFVMNYGNEGNRQRLMDGGSADTPVYSTADAQAIIDTLTKEELDFVQATWDYIATFKPLIEAQERALTGETPEWVEPSPFPTKHGMMRGGYFPAKYDVNLSTPAATKEALTDLRMGMKGAFGAAAARNGYAKARAEEVKGRPILLSYSTIATHVNEVVHRLAWQEWLIDAGRLTRALDKDFRTYLGVEGLQEIQKLLRDVAEGQKGPKDAVERMLAHARKGATVVGLGWKLSTALLQPIGLSNAWGQLGTRAMTAGLMQYLSNPIASAEWVESQSLFMKNRARTRDMSINEIINTVRAGRKVTAFQSSFFYLIGKLQRTVDIPTYLAGYEKSLAEQGYENAPNQEVRERMEKQAHAIAEQSVKDTQGAGELFDQSGVQRSTELVKLFSNFFSYMNTVYNQNVNNFRGTDFRSPKEVGEFISQLLLVNVVPAVLAVALKNMLKGSCEWDDRECLVQKYTSEQVGYLLGQMIGLRELSGVADILSGGQTYGYSGPAGARLAPEVIKMVQQMEQGDADMPAFKATNNVLGTLLHYPAGQVNNTVAGAIAVYDGEVEGWNIPKALISGPPR